MTEICPISGLPIIRNPAWMRIQLDREYWADYHFLGNSIMVAKAYGRVTADGVRKALEVEAVLIKENLDTSRTCIFLIDVSTITTIEHGGRKAHRDELVAKRKTFYTVIYYNASLLLKFTIYAGRKIHLVERTVEVVDKQEDAIRLAQSIIQSQDLLHALEIVDQEGFRQAPQCSVKDEKGSVEVRLVGSSILHFLPKGAVGAELMNAMLADLVDDSGLRIGNPRIILGVIDFAQCDSISSSVRSKFTQTIVALNQRVPVIAAVNVNVTPVWYAVIQIARFAVPFKVVVAPKNADLAIELRKIVEAFVKNLVGKSFIAPQAKDSAETRLLGFLASVSWNIPGELELPSKLSKNDSLLDVYEAIAVIKRDFDEVIQSRLVMEGDLRRLAEEAEAATKAKTQFLANMSHEIRTPLNGVIGMTDLLLSSHLDAEQKHWTETIRQSGAHLKDLVSNVLDISKIEAGEVKLEKIAFEIRAFLERCKDSWHFEAVEKGLKFSMEIHGDVPSQISGDPGRLRQILFNLVGNAIKFTQQGGVSLVVTMDSGSEENPVLLFLVKDSGIGIPKDSQHLLFQNFQQVDASTTRRFGGTGLGLYLARELVTTMGGQIGMHSEDGVGSEFWFSVPFSKPEKGQEVMGQFPKPARMEGRVVSAISPTEKEEPNPIRAPFSPPELPILLVEDNVVNRKVAMGMLRKLGCRVEVAVDGAEAVRALAKAHFALVIMDCHMPVMDGYEATHCIRAGDATDTNRNIVIIAMTANALEGDREKCIASGMDDYISKPISLHGLCEVLTRNLPKP